MFQLINNQREAKIIPEEPSITSSLYNELQKKKALLKKPRNSAATELLLGKFFYSRLL
jgi:hypothetical protein